MPLRVILLSAGLALSACKAAPALTVTDALDRAPKHLGERVTVRGYVGSPAMRCAVTGCKNPADKCCHACSGDAALLGEADRPSWAGGEELLLAYGGVKVECAGDDCAMKCGPWKSGEAATLTGTLVQRGDRVVLDVK